MMVDCLKFGKREEVMKPRISFFGSKLITVIFFALACFFFTNNVVCAHQREHGFIMLNLHWSKGEISVNNLEKVNRIFKKRKRVIKNKSFFFELISDNGENILSDYFEIPVDLKYDGFNQVNKSIEGGVIARNDLDFLVRVPHIDHIKEIRFFQQNSIYSMEEHLSSELQILENEITFLGAVSLKIF